MRHPLAESVLLHRAQGHRLAPRETEATFLWRGRTAGVYPGPQGLLAAGEPAGIPPHSAPALPVCPAAAQCYLSASYPNPIRALVNSCGQDIVQCL